MDEDNTTSGGYYTGYYVLNQQGDVIAILNISGVKVVSYEYNAWGQIKSETASATNPGDLLLQHNALKYRGYYYDADLGFYYLGSRFYDPAICRFVNADTTDVLIANPSSLTDKNLYSYCDNNPVMRIDVYGESWQKALCLPEAGSILSICVAMLDVGVKSITSMVTAITPAGWAVIGTIAITTVVIYVAPKVVNYIKARSVSQAKGKKAKDSSKNEQHGDGGRSMSKAEKQVAELREKQKQAKSSKEKNEIQKKINNIINTALKNKKGENHSQRAKR